MSDKNQGFKIKDSERQSWGSLAMVWTGSMICVPSLMVGGMLSGGFSLLGVALCILIGYGFVCLYMCFVGMESSDTGLPTVSTAESALGKRGAQFIISLLLAVACIGWFGVQSAVCGASFSAMLEGMTGLAIPVPVSTTIWGLLMLLTAIFGYNGLKYLNYIAVPALVLVLGYGLIMAIVQGGISGITSYTPPAPMSFVGGLSIVVGSFALGGVICGDYCRYAKSRKDVIKSSLLGVLPSGLLVISIGAVLSMVTGQYDITSVLSALGLPAIGLIALILATWTTNVTNAYSGGIAVSNMLGFGENKFKITTLIAGVIGTILGAAGILDRFQGFLGIMSSLIPPVAGVVIASYWIVGKGKIENFQPQQGVNVPGVISFAVGAVVAYVTGNVVPFLVGPLNGIIVSMVLFVALAKLMPAKVATKKA